MGIYKSYKNLFIPLTLKSWKRSANKVNILMKRFRLKPLYPKPFKENKESHYNKAISQNRVDHNVDVVANNKVWTTYITYILTF